MVLCEIKLQTLKNSIEWIQFLEFVGKSILSGKPDIDSLRESFTFEKKIESLSEFEKKFEDFVDSCNIQRLVIFIDDLDRCKMDATVDILEAIKLLLNSKKCVYVLGLDYERVCDAVSEQFAKRAQNVAEDYLDKIIQLTFHIPRRTEKDMKIYLRYLFALEYIKENIQDFAADLRTIEDIDQDFLTILKNYTKTFSMDKYRALTDHDLLIIRENEFNPRKLKRFLNIYEMRRWLSKVLELNLENEYLIKFLLLQTKFSDFYRDLENYPGLLRQIKKLMLLPEEKRREELEKSELLKEYYANSELLRFLRDVSFEAGDPQPYLRIAQTAEAEIILGEKEKRILNDLMSEDSLKVGEGLKRFQEVDEEQKITIIWDLLERVDHTDPHVRKGSLQAFAPLKEDIPVSMRADVVRKVVEKRKDENSDVRTRAELTLKGLKEIIPEDIKDMKMS